MQKIGEIEILEKKMASAIGFPFGTIVSFTGAYGRKRAGEVDGTFLRVEGEGWKEQVVFFSDIVDTSRATALTKNVPFPLGSTISWRGPFRDAVGRLSPGSIRYTGKVVGYSLIIVDSVGKYYRKPEELTVLNITGVVNREQQVQAAQNRNAGSGQQVQPGQNRNVGRTPNLGELTPTREQLVRAKAQLAHLGREPTEAELAAELKKVQKFTALMKAKIKSTKQGGRKSRKNRRTRRTK